MERLQYLLKTTDARCKAVFARPLDASRDNQKSNRNNRRGTLARTVRKTGAPCVCRDDTDHKKSRDAAACPIARNGIRRRTRPFRAA